MADAQPRVLVIDDDAPTVELLAELLSDEGYAVATARDVDSALASTERSGADVIILDLILADQDGAAFVERYRARGGDAPIVLLSASREAPRRAVEFHAPLVPKPFDVGHLLEIVRGAIKRARS